MMVLIAVPHTELAEVLRYQKGLAEMSLRLVNRLILLRGRRSALCRSSGLTKARLDAKSGADARGEAASGANWNRRAEMKALGSTTRACHT